MGPAGHAAVAVAVAPSTCRPKIARSGMLPALCGNRDTGDLDPDHESLRADASVLGGGDVIAAEMKEVVDLVMSREEPLRLTGRLEPLHLPFSPPRRLV